MSKPVDSRSVSRWTVTLDEERRPWQLVKRREEWANVDTGLRLEIGEGTSRNAVIAFVQLLPGTTTETMRHFKVRRYQVRCLINWMNCCVLIC